jgi:predicted nucleotidyltransferase
MVVPNGRVDSALLDELVNRVRTTTQTRRILLFGSAARDAMTADSDIDVLVVVPDGTSRRTATQAIYRRLYGFPIATDIVVVTEGDVTQFGQTEGLIIRKALQDGREIFRAA